MTGFLVGWALAGVVQAAPAGAGAAPYLDAEVVQARFTADAPLAACPLGALDLLLSVSVEVSRDGGVTEATVAGAPDAVAACLESALRAWRLPPQREPAQPVTFSLAVRAGAPLAPQGVRVPAPIDGPVLVRLPPSLSPDQRAALSPVVSRRSGPATSPAPATPPSTSTLDASE
jgi:hypothetical protein